MNTTGTTDMSIDFEHAWDTTQQIGGFFERDEAELYWNVLSRLPAHAQVVEVGLENGRSTSLPAQFSVHVRPLTLHCVDNFSTFGADGLARFTGTMRLIGADYKLWQVPSAKMEGKLRDLDLVLIDADHTDCETDCRVWIPSVKSGGWILFHDYGRPGWNIADIVETYCAGWQGMTVNSLAARCKP
jgi:hypothetical protein